MTDTSANERNVLQVRKIGNSTGVLIPKDLLAMLDVRIGDAFVPIVEKDGSLRLVRSTTEFAESMRLVEDIMDEYRDTLRELAK